RAVGADPADLGGEVVDALGPGLREEPLRVLPPRQVVIRTARDEHVASALGQALGEVRAEEAASAGDERAHGGKRTHATAESYDVAGFGSSVSQSTRPIHRARLSAYHWIVRRMPSSHAIFGCHPVSRLSLS